MRQDLSEQPAELVLTDTAFCEQIAQAAAVGLSRRRAAENLSEQAANIASALLSLTGAAHHAAEDLHEVTAIYRQVLSCALPGIGVLAQSALPQHVEQAADTAGLLDEAANEAAHDILLATTASSIQHRTQYAIKQAHDFFSSLCA
jgi:hypothetical protein